MRVVSAMTVGLPAGAVEAKRESIDTLGRRSNVHLRVVVRESV
jgi:hypothetical protein